MAANESDSRRDFLKTGAAVTATAGFPTLLATAAPSKKIKVGLVGCGGRGTGAASQAMNADDYAELVAVADVSEEQIENSLTKLRERNGDKVQVKDKHKYLGLDAYKKVIKESDVVILTTPPGFRPEHLAAVVDAGKHQFCEKPIAVDAPGYRSVLESVKKAVANDISISSGFCWRYSNYIQETFEQIHSGAIGDLRAYYATYYTSPVKPMPPESERPDGISDIDWMIANWYNFVWTAGDSLVEQAIHSVDKLAWAMKDEMPVSCVGVGGRQIPAHGGNIFDHFEVNYVWKNGFRAFMANRQIEGCFNENADFIIGSDGTCTIGKGPIPRIDGKTRWAYRGEKYNMYQREHDVLFQAIRRGNTITDGERMANSTMMGIMGRMAAYTGQEITWEQAINSTERRFPENFDGKTAWDVPPLARPGQTKFV